ncbi:MAG TPA: hypothetical protein VFI29_04340 [Hanamia sp.]|nr:hypothetical protein [Hanamia sp.]
MRFATDCTSASLRFEDGVGTNSNRACPSPLEKPARLCHSGGGWDEVFARNYSNCHELAPFYQGCSPELVEGGMV